MVEAEAVAVDAVDPAEAFRILQDFPDAQLVDVRTRAEWTFVGMPDIASLGRQVLPVEWVSFPSMAQNPAFLQELKAGLAHLGAEHPSRLLFICRSGTRSMSAARFVAGTVAAELGVRACINVAEGFEGDLDAAGHRGRANGWKVRGLPWRQG